MSKNYVFTINYKEILPSFLSEIIPGINPFQVTTYSIKATADSLEEAKQVFIKKIANWPLETIESVTVIETTFNKSKIDAAELKSILANKERNKRYANYLKLKKEFEEGCKDDCSCEKIT